jgi:glycerate kinase
VRVVLAPDKFKGTLAAADVAAAMAAGWRRAEPGAEIEEIPVADGGEGTLDALVAALDGTIHTATVRGPLGDPVSAEYAIADGPDGRVAVVEMARASGLSLVPASRRDPLRTTTYGTGELIGAAARHGPRTILVCIGGSATNDAGSGMAQALGVRLLDADGEELPPGGASLTELARIDTSRLDPAVRAAEIVVASDVDNPLTGPHGAASVFGPQKGASPEDVALLDQALGHCAAIVHRDLGLDLRDVSGAGAAGGLGGGLVAFLGARLRPGFEFVADLLDLGPRLEAADVVVTGEGRYDRQSERGKAAWGVLRLAREAGCRSVLIAGQVEATPPADVVLSLAERAGVEAAMARPRQLLEEAAEEAARSLVAA